MPLFHSAHKLPEDWNQPQIAEVMKNALDVKAAVNKLATINTWQLAATITLNPKQYSLITVILGVLSLNCMFQVELINDRNTSAERTNHTK